MSDSTATQIAFDLWLRSPPSCDVSESSPRLLLDVLPHDVRVRIAQFVSYGSQTDDLLALARTNFMQSSAVFDSLHHRYVLSSVFQLLARWVEVVSQDIKELVCDAKSLQNASHGLQTQTHLVTLCRAPTLRRLTLLYPQTDVLDAIRNSPYVREVKAHVHDMVRVLPLVETLKTLNLESVEFVCCSLRITSRGASRGYCLRKVTSLFDKTGEGSLAALFPNLRVFRMSCDRHLSQRTFAEEFDHFSLNSLRSLPQMKSVTLHSMLSDDMLQLLDGIQEVRLEVDGPEAVYRSKVPPGLVQRLTALSTDDCFSESHQGNLQECVGLVELDTGLESGSEIAFGQLLRRLDDLRKLTVRWSCEQQRDGGMFSGRGIRTDQFRYATGKDVAALFLEGNVPRVEEIRLRQVRISKEDVASILRVVGAGLKELEVDLLYQNEAPLERVVILLELVMMQCPKLQRLKLAYIPGGLWWGQRYSTNNGSREEREMQRLDAERLVGLVKRHVPMLDVSDIERVLNYM